MSFFDHLITEHQVIVFMFITLILGIVISVISRASKTAGKIKMDLNILLSDLDEFKESRNLTEQERHGFELCQSYIRGMAEEKTESLEDWTDRQW